MNSKKVFLDAEWRKLIMANYAVAPEHLTAYLPHGTVLDLWQGNAYASLIGFMFLNTKLKGIKIPFHARFEEVNLRFYVKYQDKGVWKRGVVFVKEIVPKLALSFVANTLYGEKYETLPMNHLWSIEKEEQTISYSWKRDSWNSLSINAKTTLHPILEGSEEEFITEHYWGYTKRGTRKTSEYGVEHPRWEVYETISYDIKVDFKSVYGSAFSFLQNKKPTSVFLAEGSFVKVRDGSKLTF